MAKQSVEDIKDQSRGLRGNIVPTLLSEASHFEEAEYQLLKFHGSYQQDNRDSRSERRKAKLEKEWIFMVRTKMPAGTLSAEQYLAHDKMGDQLGDSTMRLTTRQGIQLHGIVKNGLRDTIRAIVDSGLTSSGACGDVVRNTMGPGAPIKNAVHADAHHLADEINQRFIATSTAYTSIWLDGEKLEISADEVNVEEIPDEPIYGALYLPRKFKIGIAVPPHNDVDAFTQDIGLIAHEEDGRVGGYSIYVGGGFGMSHNKQETYPCLAQPLFYCSRENAAAACEAIVTVQRDHGDRSDRKHARMKYLVAERGIEWFRERVAERIDFETEPVREAALSGVSDHLGWYEQGDGKHFVGVHVAQGRIVDNDSIKNRSAFREIVETFGCPTRVTPNANLYFYDLEESAKEKVDEILAKNNVPTGEAFTALRQTAHACVAMPTCGLALAESERVFSGLMDSVDEVLNDLGLGKEPLLVRMTGCPNGCARPYNSDFAFVGRAPAKYAMYVGGSSRGDRLASLEQKVVTFDEIPGAIRTHLEAFVAGREIGESFTDFWGRTHPDAQAPTPAQFHLEPADR